MFKGFIFDVEGTLVDCVSQTLKSLQEALERFGQSYRQILVTAEPVRRRRLWADGRSVWR